MADWSLMPAGTGEHDQQESGPNSPNLHDYNWLAQNPGQVSDKETLIYHNCMYHQEERYYPCLEDSNWNCP